MAEEPKIPLLQYLPEIYQEKTRKARGDLLQDFLSVFAFVLEGLELTISELPGNFDPLAAPMEFYPWLANWVSLDLYELLEEKNRDFILKAVEFYKKKGTVSGIADLVTLLTGKKCCVKEYMNNVFRIYGMEHVSPQMGRGISKTVDTANPELLANIGTYDDEVYYVTDTGDPGLYSPDVIGLYIFLRTEEKEFIIKEDQLRKIIDSFLPVFVRAEIIIVEENYETYEIDKIVDTRKDRVHGVLQETPGKTAGTYINTVTWNLLCTYGGIGEPPEIANNLQYRTMHDEIKVELPL
jgi:phage tail-like protein